MHDSHRLCTTTISSQLVDHLTCRAQVVASTCVGAGDPVLDGYKFNVCLVDEATQVCCALFIKKGAPAALA